MTDSYYQIKSIIDPDQARQLIDAQWRTLNLIVAINNRFIEEMEKSKTLSPQDQKRLKQWTRAIAKAQQQIIETSERMNAKPSDVGLN